MSNPTGTHVPPTADAQDSGAVRAWWQDAVFYQIYPRSFADGNGDGTGDLAGVRDRVGYLRDLGVDAIWLSPFYRSPMADGGYDVSDPCDVDPIFGTLTDFDEMLAACHAAGLRVTVDLVPNHLSDQHPWFQAALRAGPGSRERERFIFRDGRGPDGDEPPNNWPSQFGGSAWKRVPDGQWYLHIFAPEQPDLNWDNPEVPAEFDRVMRFWLDRGVDGFRVDVAHGMAKPAGLPDMDMELVRSQATVMPTSADLRWDRDHVHDYMRGFRRTLEDYDGDRMAVGEVWVADDARWAAYVRSDELNLAFNFKLIESEWGADEFRAAIDTSMAAMRAVGATSSWVLSNHDVVRHVSRYGGGEIGARRARAAALVQLSLPGAVYLYNGDELGLANVELPDEALQDPIWERSGHADRGRDGGRVPLPWSGERPPFGFSNGSRSWLPMPPEWSKLSVQAQLADPGSTLNFYRHLLGIRRQTPQLHTDSFEWIDSPAGSLSFRRGNSFVVVLNTGPAPVSLPMGDVVASSGPVDGDLLPTDTAVWLRD
ncbi:MAG: glycoside hydrolase family 13 protein [Actinobacteria bacterium]|nr:glycoside hydrolase family 13 protein [Actinomycetota bacterium]